MGVECFNECPFSFRFEEHPRLLFPYASHVRWSWWSRESRLGYSTFNREEETASTKVQMQRKPNHLATFHMSAIKACAIVARAMPFNWLTSKISYLERTRLSIPQQSHLSDSHTHTRTRTWRPNKTISRPLNGCVLLLQTQNRTSTPDRIAHKDNNCFCEFI